MSHHFYLLFWNLTTRLVCMQTSTKNTHRTPVRGKVNMKTVIAECDQCEKVARFEFDEEPKSWICATCKEENGKAGIGLTGGLFL